MKPETVVRHFRSYLDGLGGISAQAKALVLSEAEKLALEQELAGEDSDALAQSHHFITIREAIIERHWDRLEPGERLTLCFPAARPVGETVEIPNKGRGTILWRRLTRRQGLEMGFRLENGAVFQWEFFE